MKELCDDDSLVSSDDDPAVDDPETDAGSSSDPMRAATLVGVASVPAGFLWIYLFGTESATVLLLAGVLVGALYSDRSVPAYRAGARTGLLAPIPEVTVQTLSEAQSVLALGVGTEATVGLIAVGVLLFGPVFWVLGASLCIVCAAVAGWLVERTRPLVPWTSSH